MGLEPPRFLPHCRVQPWPWGTTPDQAVAHTVFNLDPQPGKILATYVTGIFIFSVTRSLKYKNFRCLDVSRNVCLAGEKIGFQWQPEDLAVT